MITVKVAQFLTVELRVVPVDSERYRECSEQNKLKKEVKKIQGRGRDQGVI